MDSDFDLSNSVFVFDPNYQFDAPLYSSLTEESPAQLREAELWFDSSPNYPEHPSVAIFFERNKASMNKVLKSKSNNPQLPRSSTLMAKQNRPTSQVGFGSGSSRSLTTKPIKTVNMPGTSAVPVIRRKAPAASASKNVEIQVKSDMDAVSQQGNVTAAAHIFRARPLNRKILEAPTFPKPKKSIQRLPEFQVTHQPATRTNRTARKPLDKDLDQENKNVNMPCTSAVPVTRRRASAASASKNMETQMKGNKGGEIKTAVVQTGRRREQVISARRKVEEGSVKPVYSVRQSVRLLKKIMGQLSLKGEVKMKDDFQDKKKNRDNGVDDCKVGSKNAKDEAHHEKSGKSNDRSGDHSKSAYLDEMDTEFSSETDNATTSRVLEPEGRVAVNVPGEFSAKREAYQKYLGVLPEDCGNDETGPVDVPVIKFSSETEIAREGMELKELPVANFYDSIYDKVMDGGIQCTTGPDQKNLESAAKVVDGAIPFQAEAQEVTELHLDLERDSERPEADSDEFLIAECSATDAFPSDTIVNKYSISEKTLFDGLDMKDAVESVEKVIYVDNVMEKENSDDLNVEMDKFNTEKINTEGLAGVSLIQTEVPPPSVKNISFPKSATDSIFKDKTPSTALAGNEKIDFRRPSSMIRHKQYFNARLLNKKDGIAGMQARPRLTIPSEPQLETAHRAEKTRPTSMIAPKLERDNHKFKALPLNKKILSSKGDMGVVQSHKRETTFPKVVHETMIAPKLEGDDHKFKALPFNKKILSSKGDMGVFQSRKRETTIPKEFHLNTSRRALQHSSAVPSTPHQCIASEKEIENPSTVTVEGNGKRDSGRPSSTVASKQEGHDHNFKARPLNKKIFTSTGDIGVFRNRKRETTAPMLSLTSELQTTNNRSQLKLPGRICIPIKGSKGNGLNSFQPGHQEVTHMVRKKTFMVCGKQSQCVNDGCISKVGTHLSTRRSFGNH